jgi:hypothetical protein
MTCPSAPALAASRVGGSLSVFYNFLCPSRNWLATLCIGPCVITMQGLRHGRIAKSAAK